MRIFVKDFTTRIFFYQGFYFNSGYKVRSKFVARINASNKILCKNFSKSPAVHSSFYRFCLLEDQLDSCLNNNNFLNCFKLLLTCEIAIAFKLLNLVIYSFRILQHKCQLFTYSNVKLFSHELDYGKTRKSWIKFDALIG